MKSLPNPFLSDPAATFPNAAAGQAVASELPPYAAADLCPKCNKDMSIRPGAVLRCDENVCPYWRFGFEPPSSTGGSKEAPAANAGTMAVGATDLLGSPIGDVGELFHFARLLVAQARIHPGTISPAAVAVAEEIRAHEEAYYDPPPLFLQRAAE